MPATVLIVANDPDMRDLISALLTEEGFQIVAVSDGVAALHIIRTRRPALAIIDLTMPVMDGRELIERLRQEPEPPLPIIAMSAALSSDSNDHIEADACLSKPFDLEELLEHVTYLISQQPGPPAANADDQFSLISAGQSVAELHQATSTRIS